MIDKFGKLKNMSIDKKIIIECGSGGKKTIDDSIAIDVIDSDYVDIIGDLNKGFPLFEDNSVDEIISHHFLEHLTDLEYFLKESLRILKKGGKFRGTVPHFSNPYYYSDYTHNRPFGLYSFSYFSKNSHFKRLVPTFYNDLDFKINELEIVFYSPFYFRSLCKRIFHKIVNLSKWNQEFYEENFCYIMPAFEIKFELEK